MSTIRFFVFLLLVYFIGCTTPPPTNPKQQAVEPSHTAVNGALLSTKFKSLENLKTVIQIEYFDGFPSSVDLSHLKTQVHLTQSSSDGEVISILKSGISETDITHARDGNFLDRVWLAINSPYLVINRKDIMRVFYLSRRKDRVFGAGDVAFYDFAETMMYNISDEDLVSMPPEYLSEKGFINTFNHVLAQAFMTTLFSEKLADFIADTHERTNMPELITGAFTEEQIIDLETGPVDNYVDIINNEWGQELGKMLKKKHNINRKTHWTPELLANFLNDLQSYFSWNFQIGLKPFRPGDEVVIRYSNKINSLMEKVSGVR